MPSKYAEPVGTNDTSLIRAIVGEASDQGPLGMLGVAEALRNRGYSLKGVYGVNAPHIDKEPPMTFIMAQKALDLARAGSDTIGGATHWQSSADLQKSGWMKDPRMQFTKQVNGHYFFKDVKNGR